MTDNKDNDNNFLENNFDDSNNNGQDFHEYDFGAYGFNNNTNVHDVAEDSDKEKEVNLDNVDEKEIVMPPLKRRKKRRLKPGAWVLLAIFFLICGWIGYKIGTSVMDPLIPQDVEGEFEPEVVNAKDEILNVLLLGVDQRENEPARSDTIILASMNLTEKKVYLISIPRDTRVAIPGRKGKTKINHAHAYGGPELVVDTVKDFLGIPVHYYVETNFEGFEGIIDILGGITLNVEYRMYVPLEDIDLQPGLQKLSGHDALSYVRWRDDGTADIGRIKRQQKFLQALGEQANQFSTIWKIPDLLRELNKHVKTDLSLTKMITIGNKLRDLENIELETIMIPGGPEDIDGGSYWIADESAVSEIVNKIYLEKISEDREQSQENSVYED
ncbi:MAG: LCP family protein [Peptococcia bacterium]